ncbi:hypothetical protein BDA99DRAFT_533367 [Phascolomyces articulosus]|uniref:Uncharacterized protein n=1 Tax=Phascolomyces articulosus TaxID=60185 RepID=A0AAD5KLP6_9FUNG|nr:hypothetical protein BDA99DRAFT_533367 [Phascolomyces articulosus]
MKEINVGKNTLNTVEEVYYILAFPMLRAIIFGGVILLFMSIDHSSLPHSNCCLRRHIGTILLSTDLSRVQFLWLKQVLKREDMRGGDRLATGKLVATEPRDLLCFACWIPKTKCIKNRKNSDLIDITKMTRGIFLAEGLVKYETQVKNHIQYYLACPIFNITIQNKDSFDLVLNRQFPIFNEQAKIIWEI